MGNEDDVGCGNRRLIWHPLSITSIVTTFVLSQFQIQIPWMTGKELKFLKKLGKLFVNIIKTMSFFGEFFFKEGHLIC